MKNTFPVTFTWQCIRKITIRIKLTISLVAAFSFLSLSAQEGVKFTHLTNLDGLSQSTVQSIVKDRYGFMWFGTQDGLNRYDGYNFKVYRHQPNDSNSLRQSRILSLHEDRKGNLWVGTFNGLSLYDRNKDAFIHFKTSQETTNGLSHKSVTSIYDDKQNNLWIGTYWKLNLLDRKTGKITHFGNDPSDPNSISSDGISCIFEDNKNNLWVGTTNGLNILDRKTKKFKRIFQADAPGGLSNGSINVIFQDKQGRLWIGTSNGLNLYHPETGTFTSFLHNPSDPNSLGGNHVSHIDDAGNGKLWIGTGSSLDLFDPAQKRFVHFTSKPNSPTTLSKNGNITALLRDNTGILWVGTYQGSINKYDEHLTYFDRHNNNAHDLSSLSFNVVTGMAENKDGDIWIGTDGGALNLWKRSENTFVRFNPDPANVNSLANWSVLTLYQSKKNDYTWIGLYGKGVDRYDPTTRSFRHYTKGSGEDQLNNEFVYTLQEDSKGNIWIGTNGGGVNVLDPVTGHIRKYVNDPANPNSLSGNYVRCFYEDALGQVWIGTSVGLSLFDPKNNTFNVNSIKNIGLENEVILFITEDRKGDFWIGTFGSGLTRYNPKTKKTKVYTISDGLPDNTINCIIEVDNGCLWLSTNKGLSMFDPVSETFENSTLENGIQSYEFSRGAGLKAKNGDILFGGVNGFNVIQANNILVNKNIPPVCITGFKLFNKEVPVGTKGSPLQQNILQTDEITLSYDQSIFSFEFTAFDYTIPEKNQYAYMLEGFDKEWISAGTHRDATYTNLNPGTYTFRVIAANNDGVWNTKGASIKLIIEPPFWQTWWFRLASVIVIVGCIIILYKTRTRAIQKRNATLEKQVSERTQSLVNATQKEKKAREEAAESNKELERKNRDLEQFAYVASHDMQEPLRTISSFVELLQLQYQDRFDENAEKYMNFIIHASDRMRVLINDLLDYSRIGKKKESSEIDCNILIQQVLADLNTAICETNASVTVHPLPVIKGYSTELKQLFQNLVINAIKFRKKDTLPLVEITVVQKKDYWQFSVSDNGIGIDPKFHERIFIIFQKLHTRTEYAGSGIGLSNCKKIIELHKGNIWVESTPGAGTTFHFTLPENVDAK